MSCKRAVIYCWFAFGTLLISACSISVSSGTDSPDEGSKPGWRQEIDALPTDLRSEEDASHSNSDTATSESDNGSGREKTSAEKSGASQPDRATDRGSDGNTGGAQRQSILDQRRAVPLVNDQSTSQKVRPRLSIRKGGTLDLTFDDLEFDIERDADFDRSMLTPEIEQFHGKQAVIRGFMLPSFQQSGIKEFILVRDNQQCCFGPGAYIYHNVQVTMDEGKTATYGVRPLTVEDIFTIKPYVLEGKCYSVYHIQASSVK